MGSALNLSTCTAALQPARMVCLRGLLPPHHSCDVCCAGCTCSGYCQHCWLRSACFSQQLQEATAKASRTGLGCTASQSTTGTTRLLPQPTQCHRSSTGVRTKGLTTALQAGTSTSQSKSVNSMLPAGCMQSSCADWTGCMQAAVVSVRWRCCQLAADTECVTLQFTGSSQQCLIRTCG